MVPSWDSVEDIAIGPLHLGEVERPDFIVLLLGVPTSIDVDLVAVLIRASEKTAASSAFWAGVDGKKLLPLLSLEVEGVDIVEVLSLVVETTMSSKDEDLALEDTGAHVGSWRWSSYV